MHMPLRVRVVLAALLPLAACLSEQPTSPGASPVPAGEAEPLGLVEVTIAGIGTSDPSASARFPGVEAGQPSFALTPVAGSGGAGDGTIQLQSLSTGSFTRGSRSSGGVRYLYATFRVRNAQSNGTAYDLPRQNLVFLAASRANTLGGTAISSMRRFDGTVIDNPGLAAEVLPTGAVYQRGGQELRSTEPDVLQVLTEAEAASITPAPEVTSVFPYGFVVRHATSTSTRTLPANPPVGQFDGVVTFAFKLPLQPSAAQDPYSITMVFQPVDDSEVRVTQSPEEQPQEALAALAARASALGATVSVLPGGGYPGGREVCSLRTAGTSAAPTHYAVAPRESLSAISPDPFSPSASTVPAASAFAATYSGAVSGAEAGTFVVTGSLGGRYFLGESYTGNGTPTVTSPTGAFHPGEELEVVLTNGIVGSCIPAVARYRARMSVPASATFSAIPPVDTGQPFSLAFGDFNGDGRLDVAVSQYYYVEIYVGDGAGGLVRPQSPLLTGRGYGTVVAGDVDGNSTLDLLVVSQFSDDVTVLLGNGIGGFSLAPGGPIPVGRAPTGMANGDFNADGRMDVAVAGHFSNDLWILLGNGSGEFAAAKEGPMQIGPLPRSLKVGDFNRDGRLDLAASLNRSVAVVLGDGQGGFLAAPAGVMELGDESWSLVAGDFNGDGLHDLVSLGFAGFSVFRGVASGGFAPPTAVLYPSSNLPDYGEAGDFDGDGQLDIAVATVGDPTGTVVVMLGDGSGDFSLAPGSPFPASAAPYAFGAGDMNGDGRLDLVVGDALEFNVSVLLNQP